jgi:Mn-dependent DtxR family transcriptional regulator
MFHAFRLEFIDRFKYQMLIDGIDSGYPDSGAEEDPASRSEHGITDETMDEQDKVLGASKRRKRTPKSKPIDDKGKEEDKKAGNSDQCT